MLVIELDRENLEYDVHSLVQAFYPEEQVRVLIPESSREKRAELEGKVRIWVAMGGNGATVRIDGRDYFWDSAAAGGENLVAVEEGNAGRDEDAAGREECDAGREEDAAAVEEGDAAVDEDADLRKVGQHQRNASEEEERKRFKDGFKRFLYQTLCQVTGRSLPWGSLTGIRPTKIAYQMLEQGKGREEITAYYRDKYFVSQEKADLSVDIAERERMLLAKLGRGKNTGSHGDASGRICEAGDSAGYSQGYSLYIGIPFCPTTCLYCSFTSFPIGGYRKSVDPYVDCLIREMEYVAGQQEGRRLDCVYIGGGTPTTLEAEQLDRLLTALRRNFVFSDVKEFTVEAGRADSITEEKLKVLHRNGVGRISVNPQTMNQGTLDIIGRKATVEQVKEAYALAREAGFDNINMDLILGLPGELEEDVRRTIDRVVEMAPDSLTVHSLAVKRASGLNRMIQEKGMPMLHNTEETMGIAAEGAKRLGLVPYYLYRQKNMSGNFENVGYAKEGKLGLYNILIMEEKQTIIALGAGSISKRVYPDGRIERCENVKDVASFIERIDEMIERKRNLLEEHRQ